jgi:hypothetical protein
LVLPFFQAVRDSEPEDLAQGLFSRHQVAGNLAIRADFRSAVTFGNRDRRLIIVDIQAHVFLELHVLVLAFGCWTYCHIHADRLSLPGATRVAGDKHTFFRCSRTQL